MKDFPPPTRLAAIDLGSNAIRFLAVETTGPERWHELDTARAAVRLGHRAFLSGSIPSEVIDAAVEALASFRRRMEERGVERYRAVATSAVRESANGEELVRRAREEAGVEVEPITGEEEARLCWLAVRARVPLGEREWMMADLGGGSLEISRVSAERILRTESYPLGTVRLLEELGADAADDPARLRDALAGRPAMQWVRSMAEGARGAGLLTTGGSAEVLADLAHSPADERGVRRLPLERIRELLPALTAIPPAARVERFGLRPDRADVVVPAAVIYELIADLLNTDELVVPSVGVREGVLLQLASGG